MKDYDADLSNVKVGDYVASAAGWSRVAGVTSTCIVCSVECSSAQVLFDGKFHEKDKAPSVFKVPPTWLLEIIGPKPGVCELCGSCDDVRHGFNDVAPLCKKCWSTLCEYHSREAQDVKPEITGHDDNGVPLHDGDRVLVWNHDKRGEMRRFYKENSDSGHMCYMNGCTAWSSDGGRVSWKHAEKVTPKNNQEAEDQK
jgi:hypothetical protein